MKTILTVFLLLGTTAAGVIAADAKAGQAAYDKSCKNCHGTDGSGNAAVAKMMKVDLRALGSKEVQAESDADLTKVITAGKGKMKPVAAVSAADADNVVAYVRTFRK